MSKSLLYQGQPGDTAGIAITSSAITRVIDQAVVVNPTAGADWISVWIVPTGGSADDTTIIYHEMPIAADGVPVTLGALINHAIPIGGTVQIQADTAATLTVTISGR